VGVFLKHERALGILLLLERCAQTGIAEAPLVDHRRAEDVDFVEGNEVGMSRSIHRRDRVRRGTGHRRRWLHLETAEQHVVAAQLMIYAADVLIIVRIAWLRPNEIETQAFGLADEAVRGQKRDGEEFGGEWRKPAGWDPVAWKRLHGLRIAHRPKVLKRAPAQGIDA